jgi:hypothetical protein
MRLLRVTQLVMLLQPLRVTPTLRPGRQPQPLGMPLLPATPGPQLRPPAERW